MRLTPQQQRVLNFLIKNKTIQPLQAWLELSVYRLSDVIFKLRSTHNIKIDTKPTTTLNRYQEKVCFATYEYKGSK